MKYDVIVVGGGPGGLVAAKTAAELGLSVLVMERGKTPGEKNVSGTGLSPKCFRDFDFMKNMKLPNLRIATMATLHLSDENNIEKMNLAFTPSDRAGLPEAREFLTVNVYRSELDPWLAELAIAAGAKLVTSLKVVDLARGEKGKIVGVRTERGEVINGDIVIGADGVISTVARAAGLREKWDPGEVAMIINVDFGAAREDIDAVVGGNALHYWYSAIFPVGYSFFSAKGFHIGLGSYINWWPKNPHYYLQKLFELEGVQRQIKLCRGEAREFQNHMVTFLTDPKNTYGDSVMLIGDAAGFACPYEAEGVYYAMYSGRLAAQVAKNALERGDVSAQSLAEYEKKWRDSPIGEEFIPGETIEGFVRELGFNPEAARWIVPMLNDALYGLLNVADSHTNNTRNYGDFLVPYLPQLVETLKTHMTPLSMRLQSPPAVPPSPLFSGVLRKVLPLILPALARKSARSDNRYSQVLTPLIMEHFLTPYAAEKAKNRQGGK